ncbi:MAG TPA: TetR/AcrR family transcriptional regulator [Methylomirabilota bacterium]|nr:TetR/AcrR family transcriptional regulator [Methylomirabilota bacterium]
MGRVSDARERLMHAVSELIFTGSYGTTTIEQICDKAGVKKGSFYHFFESKAELAEAAVEAAWQEHKQKLDHIFSPATPPLERLARCCDFEFEEQAKLKEQYGRVLGCALCALGAEVSTQEDRLRRKVDEVMRQVRMYFETTLRDAHAAGLITGDPVAKARAVYAFHEGSLTQARIENDLEILRGLKEGTMELLGVQYAAK